MKMSVNYWDSNVRIVIFLQNSLLNRDLTDLLYWSVLFFAWYYIYIGGENIYIKKMNDISFQFHDLHCSNRRCNERTLMTCAWRKDLFPIIISLKTFIFIYKINHWESTAQERYSWLLVPHYFPPCNISK